MGNWIVNSRSFRRNHMTQLTVIIPVFDEFATVEHVLKNVLDRLPPAVEVIVVDDGSTDGTTELLESLSLTDNSRVLYQPTNGGKTSAVLRGLAEANGEWVVVQDADLEYDPEDITRLLEKAKRNPDAAVYGQRPSCWHMPSRWVFASGVLFLDCVLFFVYWRWVRDHATCYKLVRRDVLESFQLQSSGFEGCIEITAKLMLSKIPIQRVPISYRPRRSNEGKKLTVMYGPQAFAAILRHRKWRPEAPQKV